MQNRSIIVLAVLLIAIAAWMLSFQNETDWQPYYNHSKKSPYGTYILFSKLDEIFPKGVKKEYSAKQELLDEVINNETSTSYLFVGKNFEANSSFLQSLMTFVENGNCAMIAALDIPNSFLDTLGLDYNSYYDDYHRVKYYLKDRNMNFELDSLAHESMPYFTLRDSSNYLEVLATKGENKAVFVKVPWGEGSFYLISDPVIFTNIALLDTTFNVFSFSCLSYLSVDKPLLVQEKLDAKCGEYEDDRSIFDVMKSRADLRMVYYLTIALLLLFALFRSKRRQRIIPAIEPLRNTSLDFLHALSNLYFAKKDYKSVLLKRYAFLLDTIRERYYLNTETIDEAFEQRLSLKTGIDPDFIKRLFQCYSTVKNEKSIKVEVFMEGNKLLERFYSLSTHKTTDN